MTREQRSRCMSHIRGKDTGPELRLRKALWKARLRFRLHYPLPGRPDIVFVGKKIAIFVDGCFWHGCPDHAVKPKSNKEFWTKKLAGNIARDRANDSRIHQLGWKGIRIWEHEIVNDVERVVKKI